MRKAPTERKLYEGRGRRDEGREITSSIAHRPSPIVIWRLLFVFILLAAGSAFAARGVIEGVVSPEPAGPSGVSSYALRTTSTRELSDITFPGLKKKISIDLRGMAIGDVLKFLAVEGNVNIAIAQDVAGTVNLLINDVTISDIFEILLSTNNLAYQVQGNVIKVISNREYKALRGVDFHDQRQTVIYQLKYASAQAVGTLLGNMKSDVGKIVFDDSTGMLVVIDTPQRIEEMDEIVRKTDMATISRVLPTETEIFELDYAKVEDIQAEVTAALTPDVGTMRTDIRTNTFVITDLPHRMEEIKMIVKAFDRKTRQVFIEAKIVQVTLSDTFKWGVDWDRLFAGRQASKVFPGSVSVKPEVELPLALDSFGKLTVTSAKANSLNFVLELLSSIGETRILSNPHISVEEGKEATISVAEKRPYSETTTTTTDAATTESTEFTFVDVGVKLNVTPTINKQGYISMVIKPEVSAVTDTFTAGTQEVPVVESSNAESTVLVKDGTTIIIAGMIKDTKEKRVNKVPLLGDIPIVGRLFGNETDSIERKETIVFLTPRIIEGDESILLDRDMQKPIKGIRK